jgi:glycerol-3-phosphate dehydrogenase
MAIREINRNDSVCAERLHSRLTPTVGEVVWAVRHEMARTVEDFLSRRTRSLLLDARASIEMAPRVAEVMAGELGRDMDWQQAQVSAYTELARKYLMVP